jgi:hypothetical protein
MHNEEGVAIALICSCNSECQHKEPAEYYCCPPILLAYVIPAAVELHGVACFLTPPACCPVSALVQQLQAALFHCNMQLSFRLTAATASPCRLAKPRGQTFPTWYCLRGLLQLLC